MSHIQTLTEIDRSRRPSVLWCFYLAGAEAGAKAKIFWEILLLPEAQDLLFEQKLLLKQKYQTNFAAFF